MSSSTRRAAAALAALALAGASHAGADLLAHTPGDVHLGVVADLARLQQDLPRLMHGGMLAARLDELVAQGFPDPRGNLDQLVMGCDFGEAGLQEILALGDSKVPVLPEARQIAARMGAEVSEAAYRGVPLLTATLKGKASRFADLADGVVLTAHSRVGEPRRARSTVDTVAGRVPSFAEARERPTGQPWIWARMDLDRAARKAVGQSRLEHMAHMTGARAELVPSAAGVKVTVVATLTGGIKARIVAFALGRKLDGLRAEHAGTDLAPLLDALELRRDGASLVLEGEASHDEFQAGLEALDELLAGRIEGKGPQLSAE